MRVMNWSVIHHHDFRTDEDAQERKKIMRERKAIKKLHKETFALRMDMLYKLSIANQVREEEPAGNNFYSNAL